VSRTTKLRSSSRSSTSIGAAIALAQSGNTAKNPIVVSGADVDDRGVGLGSGSAPMNTVVLIGSALRRSVVEYLEECSLSVAGVIIPAGRRYESLKQSLESHPTPALSANKQELGAVLAELRPDVLVSVGWPYLFDQQIISGPWLPLNSHPTLLPKYRGPNPWFHVLANGETLTGVTVHKIDEGMDTGPVLHQEEVALTPFDTYRSLRSKVLAVEPKAVRAALEKLRNGKAAFVPQDESQASSFPVRRRPTDSELDPSVPLIELVDRIRACDPGGFPAFFRYEGQKVNVRLWRDHKEPDDDPESL
jgi:methionyl-tRNA formyltransferase